MIIKTYAEMIQYDTFDERFNYLKLGGVVGADTFGFDRIFNQMFYSSKEWRRIRNEVIVRDKGCDLAMLGYEIQDRILIHHLNPITMDDINNRTDILLNPNYLITTTHQTHNAIHYGNKNLTTIGNTPVERRPNDTCPWKIN